MKMKEILYMKVNVSLRLECVNARQALRRRFHSS